MDKSMIKGIVIGGTAAVAVAAGGVTGYRAVTAPKYAEVLAVKEATEKVKTPREVCEDVDVSHRAPVKDENRVAGTVVGAVAGGLLGSMVGSGRGNTLATVAGAAAGGYAGNRVQKGMQDSDVQRSVERRCHTVYESSTKSLGYDVTYRLDGKESAVRMPYDPGQRIPLKDGKLVIDAPPAS